jgi:phosphoribosylformylglycinamidine cyclo-ligase
MLRVFNCSIDLVVVVAREDAGRALALLCPAGQETLEIGRIEARRDGEAQTAVV